ncbi:MULTISPECIES: DUF4832 domain-containing protein [unclassified Leeuwenhoekiella]|uniref:DUF4832 domain-containing protein n=1 Tax=unclassified Leeuwenhoekiella TaxID=2615029 RepID=UPI0025C5F2DC|nr:MULTISPECIES: DUF4832 domain-containing protein [unclassified Leeuwenhoekiella]|tara:strand:- start:6426 stop:7826 length:1401 start_codon:yes stop_codon:yes gene_type:complete
MEIKHFNSIPRITGILFVAFLMLAGGCQGEDDETKPDSGVTDDTIAEISYESSTEVIANPDRGFMHTYSVMAEGDALSQDLLNYLKNEKVTLILRVYYLEKFKDAPLSQTQLDLITEDFNRIRKAGLKSILRFAYTNQMDGEDAPIQIVEQHLDQLKDVVTANSDIIPFVQAGFIGAWGEWHASSNNLTTPENKKRVLTKLLNTFPQNVMVQLRTPKFKREIFDYTQAINESVGYGTSDLARVGFHNDCFMASTTDYGTYENVAADKKYISDEAFFVPTGGETCPPSGIPAASCTTAEDEMSLLKWTYLNLDYYGPVLNGWRNDDCFDDFERKLGYRLSLSEAKFPKKISGSASLKLDLSFKNTGFAPVYLNKEVFLVFKSETGSETYEKALNVDLRRVVPDGSLDFSDTVSISGIPTGNYKLYLAIKDAAETLKDLPSYRIQLANKNTWDGKAGTNDLKHNLEIQ